MVQTKKKHRCFHIAESHGRTQCQGLLLSRTFPVGMKCLNIKTNSNLVIVYKRSIVGIISKNDVERMSVQRNTMSVDQRPIHTVSYEQIHSPTKCQYSTWRRRVVCFFLVLVAIATTNSFFSKKCTTANEVSKVVKNWFILIFNPLMH